MSTVLILSCIKLPIFPIHSAETIAKFSGGACPQTLLEGKALRALLTGALGAGIVTVQIPPRAGVKVEM